MSSAGKTIGQNNAAEVLIGLAVVVLAVLVLAFMYMRAGSGSAFALLPPQNASGNWIKIVQRVPVRIALDPKELSAHPLRVGLSVAAKVDVRDTSGPMTTTKIGAGSITADADDGSKAAVEALIAQIVRDNSGGH